MAVKISGVPVIDDTKKLTNITSMDGEYTIFHPTITNISNSYALDLSKPMLKRIMGGNEAYTYGSAAAGRTTVMMLDRTASGYTPSWPGNISFQSVPAWASNRYWVITFVCFGNVSVFATAVGYNTTPSASLSNFSLGAWQPSQSSYGSGTPWALANISFGHDASNNRVLIMAQHGNSRTGTVTTTVYANYTGLTGITSVEAQYNIASQSCSGSECQTSGAPGAGSIFGPLPTTQAGITCNPSTYYDIATSTNTGGGQYFTWSASVDSGSSNDSHTQANFNGFSNTDPHFRIKIVCTQGTFYSTAQADDVSVFCNYGPTAGINPGSN